VQQQSAPAPFWPPAPCIALAASFTASWQYTIAMGNTLPEVENVDHAACDTPGLHLTPSSPINHECGPLHVTVACAQGQMFPRNKLFLFCTCIRLGMYQLLDTLSPSWSALRVLELFGLSLLMCARQFGCDIHFKCKARKGDCRIYV
jgi:hypothetical protein